jgi:uncharacterized protein (TIGR03086 family)
MVDLSPAASTLTELVRGVRDDQLAAPTPCGGLTAGQLLDHIDSLSVAFAAAGRKQTLPGGGAPPEPDAARLGADWRDRLAAQLAELALAWEPAAAWGGTTEVGGGRMPAGVAGAAAVDELVVHGWDLAVATGQRYPGEDPALRDGIRTAYAWAGGVAAQNPDGTPGLFGPPQPVPADAPMLDRLLGVAGRDPGWRGPAD